MLNFRVLLVIATATATLALAGLGCGDDIKCHSEPVDPAQEVHRCVCMDGDDEDSTVLFTAGSTDVNDDCYVTPSASNDGGGGAGDDGVMNCTVTKTPTGALVECDDGTSAVVTDGSNGADGTSCTVREVTGGVMIECPDGTSAFIPNGGSNPPPPPVGGWQLCWLPPPSQEQILDTSWYLQQAQAYRNNTGSLYCESLGSYSESYGAQNAGYWLIANHASNCVGTINLIAGDGMRVLGGVATGSDTEVFDQYDGVTVGLADPGGCAVALVMQGGINVWVD